MSPVIVAVTATLWILSLAYLVFTSRYHYMTRGETETSIAVQRYRWAITNGAIAILVLTTLQFSNYWGLMGKWDQKELGLIWRVFFVFKIIQAFRAVNFKEGALTILTAISVGIGIYIFEVLR